MDDGRVEGGEGLGNSFLMDNELLCIRFNHGRDEALIGMLGKHLARYSNQDFYVKRRGEGQWRSEHTRNSGMSPFEESHSLIQWDGRSGILCGTLKKWIAA